MQITIQKKYLILVEVSLNIFKLFLIVVNFVFNFSNNSKEIFVSYANEVKQEIVNAWDNLRQKTFNFVRALFGFNIYKLEIIKIKSNLFEGKNFNNNKNQDFLIHSNLLAPPLR